MRVLLADDQHDVRRALRLLLEQEPDLTVAGEVADAVGLFDQVEAIQLDLVLLDWELPGFGMIDSLTNPASDAIALLRSLRPNLVVVALSGRPEAHQIAMAAGADAFVSKGDPPERLLKTLRRFSGNAQSRSNEE